MKCVIVYNPRSGGSLPVGQLREYFVSAGFDVEATLKIGSTLGSRLAPYIKRGRVVAAIGGDGTISSVAGLLRDTKATLLPLPGGTLNHFVGDLGVPGDLEQALQRAAKLPIRTIDVASVNGLVFINNSSIGLYPKSLRVRGRLENRLGKWPAAVVGVLRSLVTFHHYRLTINGREITTSFVFVGNNTYKLGTLGATERKHLDRHQLFVAIVRAGTRWQLVKIFVAAVFGRPPQGDDFDTFVTDETLTISTRRRALHISHDGELSSLAAPLSYSIHPNALRILA